MDTCIFCKIARHDVPKEFIFEDEDIMVFPDIRPRYPVHLLIIPKKHIVDFLALEDKKVWEKIRAITQQMIRKFDLTSNGFRFSTNGGGAQEIDHLHFHLVGSFKKTA